MPQLIAREEAKDQILEYIRGALSQDDYYWESGSNINKCAVLTTAGIKGTGKTRVLHEMCTTWRDETGAKAAVTVDFNGGSYWDHSKAATEVFSKLLLQQSGMPAEKAENCAAVLSFKQVMQCLREKLNLGADDLLLVGIDEIRQFETLAGKDRAVQLVSNLMGAQDESLLQTSNCPVIFVWTSMLESYMSTLMSDSGRYVLLPISLRGLPLVEALQLLPEELRRRTGQRTIRTSTRATAAGSSAADVRCFEKGVLQAQEASSESTCMESTSACHCNSCQARRPKSLGQRRGDSLVVSSRFHNSIST